MQSLSFSMALASFSSKAASLSAAWVATPAALVRPSAILSVWPAALSKAALTCVDTLSMALELEESALFRVLTVPSKAVPRLPTLPAVSRSRLPASSVAESELEEALLVVSMSACAEEARAEKVRSVWEVVERSEVDSSSAVSSLLVKPERFSSVR